VVAPPAGVDPLVDGVEPDVEAESELGEQPTHARTQAKVQTMMV
jgi:hypothetical protein